MTVLCVDDDPPMRRALRRQLERMECRVLEASSAADARRLLAQCKIDIVVTDLDLGVPGDGGRDLLADVAASWPATGRVLASGSFTSDQPDERPLVHATLDKPIDLDALRHALALAVRPS